MQQELLDQRQFIASQINEVNKKMDERFEQMDKKMDERFEQVDKKMDERFKQVDERFDKQDGVIQGIQVQLENARAITRNGRLRRMHQPINLIKVLKPTRDPKKSVWTSHPKVPKHMKDTYSLG